MDLIVLVLVVTVIAIIVWYITTKIPDPTLKLVIQALVGIVLLLFVLRQLHILPNVL